MADRSTPYVCDIPKPTSSLLTLEKNERADLLALQGVQRGIREAPCTVTLQPLEQISFHYASLTLEEVLAWAQSFEKLMATKHGPVVYAAYLKMEHSEENIKFWMACETYKKTASRWSRISQAKKLYKIYIQPQSPQEINIDSSTRDTIFRNIQEPTEMCFEEAQRIVYTHMERDSYPRFLKSEMYQKLVKAVQPNNHS